MIKSVHETYVSKHSDPKDCLLFWTYLICKIDAGKKKRYSLVRIDNTVDEMEVLGRELSLKDCRTIIKKYEPNYKKASKKDAQKFVFSTC